MPGGGRFVFWRGACYVPFWAGPRNTGLSYEWAETTPPADGFQDCVEPLMDKELRYGRVEILESTPARVRVRWTYQSCDFNYKVWGDLAWEDFCFYPDGFGTRTLTIQCALDGNYELSEFIILTPQGAFPFEVLPENLVDILFLDGEKRRLRFPYDPAKQGGLMQSRNLPAVYRVRMHREQQAAAIYFHPEDRQLPPVVFGGFQDKGHVVTPCYWGSHWPLARGQTTGGAIDDRIYSTPTHNSVMSWAMQRPPPLRALRKQAVDTLGREKEMRVETWAWLIGFADVPDERLLQWARGFANPPQLQVEGGIPDPSGFSHEQRAFRIQAIDREMTVFLTPAEIFVNPVFEIQNAPGNLTNVSIDGRALAKDRWAWDGKVLWINHTFEKPSAVSLKFNSRRRPVGR